MAHQLLMRTKYVVMYVVEILKFIKEKIEKILDIAQDVNMRTLKIKM